MAIFFGKKFHEFVIFPAIFYNNQVHQVNQDNAAGIDAVKRCGNLMRAKEQVLDQDQSP